MDTPCSSTSSRIATVSLTQVRYSQFVLALLKRMPHWCRSALDPCPVFADPNFAGHGYEFEGGLPADSVSAEANRYEYHVLKQKHSLKPKKLIGVSPPVNSSDVARLSTDLVGRARINTQWYQSTNKTRPTIMLPWGTDWGFSNDAHIEFENMDKIVAYINAHSAELKATVRCAFLVNHHLHLHKITSTAIALSTLKCTQLSSAALRLDQSVLRLPKECAAAAPYRAQMGRWASFLTSCMEAAKFQTGRARRQAQAQQLPQAERLRQAWCAGCSIMHSQLVAPR
eukprot:SAG11_NODE_397_length_9785_cov_3.709581_6_plen_284_part_00